MIMDDKAEKYLWALRKVNEALIEALKMAIVVLEKEEELSKERRKSLTESLKDLVAQCEEIYPEPPTKH
jgi:hypothetical protein